MRNPASLSTLLAMLLITGTPGIAMEWLDSNELEDSCDRFLAQSNSKEGALCLAYMQGFIAGSGTATAASGPTQETAANDESFADRAARTRLGTMRLHPIRNSGDSGHCLDDNETAVSVVENIAGYLNEHPETLKLNNAEAVREALVHHYPCST